MSYLAALKEAKKFSDFAKLLGYQTKHLSYIVYKIPEEQKYITFKISKKNGGSRDINAPSPHLKELQSRLAELLNSCYEELLEYDQQYKNQSEFARKRAQKAVSHGFKKGLSICTNAEMHLNRKYLLNMDLEQFFPSINFGRIRGYFIKNRNFQLNTNIATVIAQIACHKNGLPQGSPCSPIISNLIAKPMDMKLIKLAKDNKCTYSRYADDLSFSTNQKLFPLGIAFESGGSWTIGAHLVQSISKSGFGINHKKTRMQLRGSRQTVTGLVVNKNVNVRLDYYRNARAMCNEMFHKGTYHLFGQVSKPITSMGKLAGILNHIYHIKSYRNKYAQKGYRKFRHDGYINPKRENENPTYPPLNRCSQYSDKSHQVAIDGIKNLYAKFIFSQIFTF